jgi:hypothetical protein
VAEAQGDQAVSICIPAYEAAGFIERTLDCACAQRGAEVRILVSIDVCEDATEEICRARAAEDERIDVIAQPERLGWAQNVNFLLDRAETEFAFVYFHDDLIESAYCERLMGALQERPDAASAHCDVGHFGGSDKVIEGLELDGPAPTRLFEFLIALRRPSILRSMLRVEACGAARLSTQASGIWANQPFLAELIVAGPALHVPEVLYRRWDRREGGVTDRWRKLPFEQIVEGFRANAQEVLRVIDDLGPSGTEREQLVFALFLYMMGRVRRGEGRYGATSLLAPEELVPEFAGMSVPPAVEELEEPVRERCMASWDRYQRRTGRLALELGDAAAAIAAYEDLAARHPGNRAFPRQLRKARRAAGEPAAPV